MTTHHSRFAQTARLASLVCAVLTAIASAHAAPPTGSCGAKLPTPLTARFVDDMRTKDLDDILAHYTPDATFMDPSGAKITGTDNLRTFYQHIFATFDSELTFTPTKLVKVKSHGDLLCVESGTYTENMRVRASSEMQHPSGTYRFTYRLGHDNQWLLYRQEWGSNETPPAAPPKSK